MSDLHDVKHVPERLGIVIDRDTLEYWAGRDLSDDDVRQIICRIRNDNYAMLPDLVRTLAAELKADQL